jgi:hypothetical protein
VLRWTEVDRLLALALTIYEDGLCPGCGQPKRMAMDPDLAEEWTSAHPWRCGGCMALSRAAKRNEKDDHPHALRYVIGLREGWERRKAKAVAERATSEA